MNFPFLLSAGSPVLEENSLSRMILA